MGASARRCHDCCSAILPPTPPTLRASEALSLARPRPVGRHSAAKMTTTLPLAPAASRSSRLAPPQRQWGAPIGSVRRSSRDDDESRCVLRYRCMSPFVVVDNRMRFFEARSTICILDFMDLNLRWTPERAGSQID